MHSQPECSRRLLRISHLGLGARKSRVHQHGERRRLGNQCAQQPQPLRLERARQQGYSGHVGARPVQAGNKTDFYRVAANREHDRDGRGGRFGGQHRRLTAARDDHGHAAANQISRHRRQSVILTIRPAKFDRHVAALGITGLAKALAERDDQMRHWFRR
jgi:hypothetical protein